MSMHGTSEFNAASRHLEEDDVLLKRPRHHHKSPRGKSGMSEARDGPKKRMGRDQGTRSLNRFQVPIGDIPAGLFGIPRELPLEIGDEVAGTMKAQAHRPDNRLRTRSLIPSKSSRANGAVGLSAASSNQASKFASISNGSFCGLLKARRALLTRAAALGVVPRRTCSSTNALTSSASMTCMLPPSAWQPVWSIRATNLPAAGEPLRSRPRFASWPRHRHHWHRPEAGP